MKYLFPLWLLSFVCCKDPVGNAYSRDPRGYYYRLLGFTRDSGSLGPGTMAALDLVFCTQLDSVFWDSHNNLGGPFYVKSDPSPEADFLAHHLTRLAPGDSGLLLLNCKDFYDQTFASRQIPFFSTHDSVVKVFFRLREETGQGASLPAWRSEEQEILSCFASPEAAGRSRDISGFYWLQRPGAYEGNQVRFGDQVAITYTGTFLNGRPLERCSEKLEFIYGTPDQVLKGVNYVIPYLKPGQSAKIILPSRLAFGENGSSNGTVPPHTPLIYHVTLVSRAAGSEPL